MATVQPFHATGRDSVAESTVDPVLRELVPVVSIMNALSVKYRHSARGFSIP